MSDELYDHIEMEDNGQGYGSSCDKNRNHYVGGIDHQRALWEALDWAR